MEQVEFWFDAGCPFTWRTSRWLLDAAAQRDLTITWRLMSLPILNEGKDLPDDFRPYLEHSARTLRVLAAAEEAGGQRALATLYTDLGTRRHEQGADWNDDTLRAAVAAAGLPGSVLAAADEPKYDEVVRRSHTAAQDRAGTEVGSPVLAIAGGRGFFGPVVVPPPTGADAAALYDGIRLLASVPGFSEFKGSRADL